MTEWDRIHTYHGDRFGNKRVPNDRIAAPGTVGNGSRAQGEVRGSANIGIERRTRTRPTGGSNGLSKKD